MTTLDARSLRIRKTILDVIQATRRGHIASAFSIVEIVRVLYDDILKIDPRNPAWAGRDRFILSKGHACLALYVLLAEKGFFPREELFRFCTPEGILGGHPEHDRVPGIEASTGSLGHGLAIAVGLALNARYARADYRTFVLLSDGECNEGSTWESALSAAKHRLNRLTAIVDYNGMQCFSTTDNVLGLEPFADKWRSFGFEVRETDGHDVVAITQALKNIPYHDERPSLLICHTIKGKGIPFMEQNPAWHHKSKIADEEMRNLYAGLGDVP